MDQEGFIITNNTQTSFHLYHHYQPHDYPPIIYTKTILKLQDRFLDE